MQLTFFQIAALAAGAAAQFSDDYDEDALVPCAYEAIDGFVLALTEDLGASDGWELSTVVSGYSGSGYLVWAGGDSFSTPGVGATPIWVYITSPGKYVVFWRSYNTVEEDPTEHNDNWLKCFLPAEFYYGEKQSDGSRVYPAGSNLDPQPEGESADGWFKVYMNARYGWTYDSSTSDFDPHDIYAEFHEEGIYKCEISGRSDGHAIDAVYLARYDALDYDPEPVYTLDAARSVADAARPSPCVLPEGVQIFDTYLPYENTTVRL